MSFNRRCHPPKRISGALGRLFWRPLLTTGAPACTAVSEWSRRAGTWSPPLPPSCASLTSTSHRGSCWPRGSKPAWHRVGPRERAAWYLARLRWCAVVGVGVEATKDIDARVDGRAAVAHSAARQLAIATQHRPGVCLQVEHERAACWLALARVAAEDHDMRTPRRRHHVGRV
eukprot:scaffold24133_cov59-Phaeocystis_antarctica.AAC.2